MSRAGALLGPPWPSSCISLPPCSSHESSTQRVPTACSTQRVPGRPTNARSGPPFCNVWLAPACFPLHPSSPLASACWPAGEPAAEHQQPSQHRSNRNSRQERRARCIRGECAGAQGAWGSPSRGLRPWQIPAPPRPALPPPPQVLCRRCAQVSSQSGLGQSYNQSVSSIHIYSYEYHMRPCRYYAPAYQLTVQPRGDLENQNSR